MVTLRILIHAAIIAAAPVAAAALERLPAKPPVPADNPQTPAKVELGRKLFFDPRLSLTGTVSCNSCHNVMEGGDDDRAQSMGVLGQKGGRNAPTVWNAAYLSVQFWDGRAASLEDQAKGPLVNPVEMAMPDHDAVVARLRSLPGYVDAFAKAFGGSGTAAVTIDRFAQAVAAYERTLVTPNSPFDRWLGGDKKAISAAAQAGAKLFTSLGCEACHSGPAFAGPALPAGTGWYQKFPVFREGNPYVEKYQLEQDLGRFEVTKVEADKHMFRVPTLRNVALTAPYFHNGAVTDLSEAVRVMAKSQLNKDLTDAEVDELTAFLESLTGEFPAQSMPRLPGLSGTTIVR